MCRETVLNRWNRAIATSTVALLAPLVAAPAQAAVVRPSKVNLTDAAGHTNGCVAKIPTFVIGTIDDAGASTPGVRMQALITCPASADVHRLSFKVYLFEVRANGTLRGLNGPDGLLGAGVKVFDGALTGTYNPFGDFGVLCGPQYPQNTGLHTWLVRALFHTRHSTTDPVPFVGQFDHQQQVSCH